MPLSNDDRLLIAAKLIVNDMLECSNNQVDSSLFMGMGFALGRVYSILRGLKPQDLRKIKPKEMMEWVQNQPIEGAGNNSKKLVRLIQ